MENLDNPGRYVWLPLQMPEIPTTKRILHGAYINTDWKCNHDSQNYFEGNRFMIHRNKESQYCFELI
jgi:hypothetical protein